MLLPITAITAAILALLLLALAMLTVKHRLALKAAHGDAEDPGLIAASRSHGNLAEHAPIVLIMLGLLEHNGACAACLTAIAAVFVIGRFAHAWGLHIKSAPGKSPIPRQIGVVATWLTILALAGWLMVMALGG